MDPKQPAVPKTWPGAFEAYKYSRDAVKFNLGTVVLLWLLAVILSIFDFAADQLLVTILVNITSVFLTLAMTLTYINSVRRQKIDLNDSLSQTLPLLLKGIGLTIIVGLSVLLGLLLLIVPGLIMIARLSLATYFLVDKNMGIVEAYNASWTATEGHAMKIWGIIGVTLLMALLVLTIVGIPVAIYLVFMYTAAFAVLYEHIRTKKPAPASTT